jgi:hypothetical protein
LRARLGHENVATTQIYVHADLALSGSAANRNPRLQRWRLVDSTTSGSVAEHVPDH